MPGNQTASIRRTKVPAELLKDAKGSVGQQRGPSGTGGGLHSSAGTSACHRITPLCRVGSHGMCSPIPALPSPTLYLVSWVTAAQTQVLLCACPVPGTLLSPVLGLSQSCSCPGIFLGEIKYRAGVDGVLGTSGA